MKKNRIIFLVVLLILSASLHALDPNKKISQYLIDTWTNKDGLPQNFISAITQTRKGYIWIGTQEGVVRFDGIKMLSFNSRNVSEFKNSMVTSLVEDKYGTLWIGTYNGLMSYKNNKFKLFTVEDGLIYNLIRCLGTDEQGDLWIGTDNGISKFENSSFKNYEIPSKGRSNYINNIIIDRNNNLLVSTKDDIFKLVDEKFISLNLHNDLNSNISVLYSDRLNVLWVGTVNNGLFTYTSGKLIKYSNNDKLSGNYITAITEDIQQNLWIGTQNGGLNKVNKTEIDSFTEKEGLSNNFILALFTDREKNLWIGTSGSGLNRLRDGKVLVYGHADGITSEYIRTVFEDSSDNLWVGSGDGGIYKNQGETFKAFDGRKIIRGNVIRSLMEDPDGNIWIGTIGSGLCIIKGDVIEKFLPGNELLSDNIFSILKGSDDTMWVGSGSGLSRYKSGKFENFVSAGGAALNEIRGIVEDSKKNIWLLTMGRGIAKFDGEKFVFIDKKNGLSSDIAISLYFDKKDIAWIGTYGAGLNWMSEEGIKSINVTNGLADNVIYTILEDEGKLWMSSNNGIFNVDREELIKFGQGKIDNVSCISYNESSGMKNRECNGGNTPAGWKTRKGILWFPTIEGLVKINPKSIKQDDEFPPLVIENLIVDGKELDLKGEKIISPGYKRLEFQYTALSFINPKDIHFKVRLKGMKEGWVNMEGTRKTYYTLIPPGKYTFELVSTNGEGRWNEVPVSMEIHLQPYFYETNLFYFLVSLLLIISAFLYIRWRLRSLNQRKIELELEVKSRTKEIRLKNIELEKLSIVARETNSGVLITSVDGNIEWVNEGFERMFGYTLEQLYEERGHNITNCSFREELKDVFKECLKSRKAVVYESANKTRTGKNVWTQTSLTPILDENNEVKKLVFVETDISKLRKALDKMKEMSLTDPLTKLKNRRYFHNLIVRDVEISRRKLYKASKDGLNYSMLFLMVDIDFFKNINDTYGHQAGDLLLIQVSKRMRETLRVSDLLVRWGGEEFLIMTKDDNIEGARLLSIRLLKAIEEKPFILNGNEVEISISIGFCGFPILKNTQKQFGWEDIVHLADSALYISKNSGRKKSAGVKIINGEVTEADIDLIKNQFDKAIEKRIIEIIISNKDS